MQASDANVYKGVSDSPQRYGKGLKPHGASLDGIIGNTTPRATKNLIVDKHTKRENLMKKKKI